MSASSPAVKQRPDSMDPNGMAQPYASTQAESTLTEEFAFVSMVVPCRNEEKHIESCLDSMLAGDYPKHRMEIIVVDGMSQDRTREIVSRYAQRSSQVVMLDNPSKTIPAAMNLGIRRAQGEIVAKMDAHSTYPKDYISKCVLFMHEYGADNVGGIWKIRPGDRSTMATAIGLALSHRFGSGNAYVKVGCKGPRWSDTVSFGCFKKAVFERVGFWNEELAGSSDMDFNVRLKDAGGKILLVPAIVTDYFADPDLQSMCRHNFADGVWATYVMKFKSRAWSWRHWIPMGFVASVAGAALLAVLLPGSWWLACTIVAAYVLGNLAASVQISFRERRPELMFFVPLVFATRHLSHGIGALYGLLLALLPGKHWKGRRGAKA